MIDGKKIYNVTEYGAVGDGATDNTDLLRSIIDAVGEEGGVLYFPDGRYLTATVMLKSRVTLMLSRGCVLVGCEDHSRYPMIEGIEGYGRRCHFGIIAAECAEDVAVVGEGVIDARGECWWYSGKSDYERPRALSFIKCRGVLVEGVTVVNSPCWTIHPVLCDGVTVRGVRIKNPYESPNTDGINPESCSDVLIEDSYIDVGDDCVTLKSGTETDPALWSKPTERVTVHRCTMAHGHGGVVIGSETSGGIRDVVVKDCVFEGTERGIRIKTRRYRGGYVKNVTVEGVRMEGVGAAITVNEYYRCGEYSRPKELLFDPKPIPVNEMTPEVSGIVIRDVEARGTLGVGIYMYGLPELPISDVRLERVRLGVVGTAEGFPAVTAYSRKLSFGEGVFLENTRDIVMTDTEIDCVGEPVTVIGSSNILMNGEVIA